MIVRVRVIGIVRLEIITAEKTNVNESNQTASDSLEFWLIVLGKPESIVNVFVVLLYE